MDDSLNLLRMVFILKVSAARIFFLALNIVIVGISCLKEIFFQGIWY